MALTELGGMTAIVIGCWFAALFGVTAIKAFRGDIVTAGILSPSGGQRPTVGRMQLVLATLAVAIGYAGTALVRAPGEALPDMPTGMLLALLGSNGLYLGEKHAFVRRSERR